MTQGMTNYLTGDHNRKEIEYPSGYVNQATIFQGNKMSYQDKIQQEILPIPDILHVRLTTYDSKHPETNIHGSRRLAPDSLSDKTDKIKILAKGKQPCHRIPKLNQPD
jgi:hypothetical protein